MKLDPYSPTWQIIEAHLKERMTDLRARLEGDISRKETTKVRAGLRECKLLLELAGDNTPLIESDMDIPG